MHNLVAGTYWASRRMPEAIAAVERSLVASRRSGDPIIIARHLNNLGTFRSMMGDNVEAKELLEESLALSESTGDEFAISSRLDSLGELCVVLGRYAEAERHLLRSLRLRPKQTHKVRWLKTLRRLALLCLETGRYAEGLGYAEKVVEAGTAWYREASLRLRGWLRLAMGDLDGAYADVTSALDGDRENRYVGEVAELLEPLALCLSERGDQQAALTYARECLESGRAGGVRRDEAAACLLLSTIHNRLKEYAAAAEFGEQARGHYEHMREPLRLGRSLVALSRARAGLGDVTAARRCRDEAEAIFTRLGVLEFETL